MFYIVKRAYMDDGSHMIPLPTATTMTGAIRIVSRRYEIDPRCEYIVQADDNTQISRRNIDPAAWHLNPPDPDEYWIQPADAIDCATYDDMLGRWVRGAVHIHAIWRR